MDTSIMTKADLAKLYAAAPANLSHDDKVQHVAGQWFVNPLDVESALAKRESNHTAAMECGA